ncbi:MAG: DUF4384 domain-containing protein [Bacteroides sp.]|nr:DUF4384 domain-containing protein [Bacteroides sp.]
MRRVLLSLLFLFSFVAVFSQRTANISATYTFYAPETISVEEAKRVALERAKNQAIADEFGTIVSQSNSTVISNKNGISDERFYSYGGSEIRGEWIETIGDPKFDISYKDKTLIVTCSVKGKAREISPTVMEFIAKPLRNGTEEKFESTSFKDGDDLFLYFQSPVNGFLTIYLLDETSQTVYCILPYKSQGISTTPIEANKEYIFFSRIYAEKETRGSVDEYSLSCQTEKEFNTLYVLFSPYEIGKQNKFVSSIENKPSHSSYIDFKRWLSKTLSRDSKIQYQEINITISK